MRKSRFLLCFLAVSFILSLNVQTFAANAETVKFGAIVSMIGGDAPLGEEEKRAFDVGVELLNSKGGIKGHLVELLIVDGQSKPEAFAVRANRLLEENVLAAIGGEDISFVAAAGQVFEEGKTVFIDLAGTTPAIALVGDFVFMNPMPDNDQARAIAKYAVDTLGYKKFTIFKDVGSTYGTVLTDYLTYYLKEFTGDKNAVPYIPSYNLGDTDFSSQITRLKPEISKNNIEVIILPTWPDEAPLIAKQCRDLGIKLPFIGTDGADTEVLTQVGGNAVEGMLLATHFDIEMETLSPLFKEFAELHKERFGEYPGAFGALAFDALVTASESVGYVINEKGDDWWKAASLADKRLALRNAMVRVETTGTSQTLSFSEEGYAKRGLVWRVVKDGNRVFTDFLPYSDYTPEGINTDPLK